MPESFFLPNPEQAAFVPAYRAIGPAANRVGQGVQNQQIPIIYADVVVEEEHRDDLVITEHPVETGAAISDHAFKRPSTVTMRCGWSSSSLRASGITYPADMRRQLLNLQAARLPFDLYTGKQAYTQMLIASLLTHTGSDGEYSLLATIVFQQVILVATKVVKAPLNTNLPQLGAFKDGGPVPTTPAGAEFNNPGYKLQDPTTGRSLLPPGQSGGALS